MKDLTEKLQQYIIDKIDKNLVLNDNDVELIKTLLDHERKLIDDRKSRELDEKVNDIIKLNYG